MFCIYLVLMDTLCFVLDYLLLDSVRYALLFYTLTYSISWIYMSVLMDTLHNLYYTIIYQTTTTQASSLSLVSELD